MSNRVKVFQSARRHNRVASLVQPSSDVVHRSAVHCHTLRKAGVLDGVSSTTGLFDEAFGDAPDVFNVRADKLDIANALLEHGYGLKQSSKVASGGVDNPAPTPSE